VDERIIDRYRKIRDRRNGTDNAHERESCQKQMDRLEVDHPGIGAEATLRDLDERLTADTAEAPRGTARGPKVAKGVGQQILDVLGLGAESVGAVGKFLDFLKEHEEIGRAVLGGGGDAIEPPEDLIEDLAERMHFFKAETAKMKVDRKAPRRNCHRFDFAIPVSVWEDAISDGDEIDPEGAVALVEVLLAALEDGPADDDDD
jgi:hypothetical protein